MQSGCKNILQEIMFLCRAADHHRYGSCDIFILICKADVLEEIFYVAWFWNLKWRIIDKPKRCEVKIWDCSGLKSVIESLLAEL